MESLSKELDNYDRYLLGFSWLFHPDKSEDFYKFIRMVLLHEAKPTLTRTTGQDPCGPGVLVYLEGLYE